MEVYNTFDKAQYQNVVLYVPLGSLEAYQTADYWRYFQNMQGFDAAGINNVKTEEGDGQNMYYDMSGRKSATPHHGVNIVRYSDGTTRKVIMK